MGCSDEFRQPARGHRNSSVCVSIPGGIRFEVTLMPVDITLLGQQDRLFFLLSRSQSDFPSRENNCGGGNSLEDLGKSVLTRAIRHRSADARLISANCALWMSCSPRKPAGNFALAASRILRLPARKSCSTTSAGSYPKTGDTRKRRDKFPDPPLTAQTLTSTAGEVGLNHFLRRRSPDVADGTTAGLLPISTSIGGSR